MKATLLSIATLQIVSMNVTGVGFWDFLTAGTKMGRIAGSGASHDAITLQEILAGSQMSGNAPISGKTEPLKQIMDNTTRNLLPMVFSLAGVKVLDRVLTKVGFNRSFNRLARQVGVSNLVRA